MWGNLAGKLKENLDVNALRETIHHVADVVAPALSDEEEYETDEEEEYEYYEEEDVREEHPPQEQQGESLGAMLQHMLDDEEEQHHRSELKEKEERHVERHMRPIIPDEEVEEEVISFEQEPAAVTKMEVKQTGREQNSTVPPPVVETTRASSPPVEAKHFPGVPVPHVHKETSSKIQSLTSKKERILRTEPVRVENDKSGEKVAERGPAREEVKASANEVHKQSGPDFKYGKETIRVPETRSAASNEDATSNGRAKSVAPVAASKPSVAAETAKTEPEENMESIRNDVAPVTKEKARSAPSPPPVQKQSLSVPSKTRVEPETRTKVRSTPSPPPVQKQALPVPSETRIESAANEKVNSAPWPPPVQQQSPSAPPEARVETTAEDKVRSTPSPPPVPELSQRQSTPEQEPTMTGNETNAQEEVPVAPVPPSKKPNTQELLKKANAVVSSSKKKDSVVDTVEMQKMQHRCQDLEKQLQHAELHIVELQRDAAQRMDEEEEWRESHLRQFQEEQARSVEAATEAIVEEHKRELAEMRDLFQQECFALKEQLEEERTESQRQVEQFQQVLEEAEARAETAETEKRRVESQKKSAMSQIQQHQEHAVRIAEDKLAHSLAKLDEREEEVTKLKAAIKELKASTTEHREVAQEAEEEMDELHAENETLQHNLHAVEAERDELNKQLKLFNSQKEKMHGLQMELRMLKEARDRERANRQNAAVDAESSQAELLAERDVALSTARDIERQLTATLADLDIAKADADRIMMANVNLQNALEAFQSERDAEMNLIQDQRVDAEEATAAAHAAAIEATHEANEARMREVQMAADAAVKNVMREVHELEEKLEDSRKENANLRHSLDEAIRRLQTSQEDVIDRVFMKNILLDWFSKTGKGKRDVLTLMASVLHFTEEEKDVIHIGDHSGTLGKVVGAVAAPLPPSAADIDHLEGDTVREKWVNFLLAETGGEDDTNKGVQAAEPSATNGDVR